MQFVSNSLPSLAQEGDPELTGFPQSELYILFQPSGYGRVGEWGYYDRLSQASYSGTPELLTDTEKISELHNQ